MLLGSRNRVLHVAFQRFNVVDDFHGPATENVRRPHDQRKSDASADLDGAVNGCGSTVLGVGNIQRIQQSAETVPIFSQVDGIR